MRRRIGASRAERPRRSWPGAPPSLRALACGALNHRSTDLSLTRADLLARPSAGRKTSGQRRRVAAADVRAKLPTQAPFDRTALPNDERNAHARMGFRFDAFDDRRSAKAREIGSQGRTATTGLCFGVRVDRESRVVHADAVMRALRATSDGQSDVADICLRIVSWPQLRKVADAGPPSTLAPSRGGCRSKTSEERNRCDVLSHSHGVRVSCDLVESPQKLEFFQRIPSICGLCSASPVSNWPFRAGPVANCRRKRKSVVNYRSPSSLT